jgi:hypothetical protein
MGGTNVDRRMSVEDHNGDPFKVGMRMFVLQDFVSSHDIENGVVIVRAFLIHEKCLEVLIEFEHPRDGGRLWVSPLALMRYLSVSHWDKHVDPTTAAILIDDRDYSEDFEPDYSEDMKYLDTPAYNFL